MNEPADSDEKNLEETQAADATPNKALGPMQRRILGVLMEKARTTPDAYPLSLNGLVTGCNQKSNRQPLMNLQPAQVEDELVKMRTAGIVAEVQGGSRVPKYRHYAYDFLGVKGTEAAILTELLLRGEQTAGELRTRASRFEPIADLQTLQGLLDSLMARGLVVALTPAGRRQLLTHNLYLPEELERLKKLSASAAVDPQSSMPTVGRAEQSTNRSNAVFAEELALLRDEVSELRQVVDKLTDRLDRLEG